MALALGPPIHDWWALKTQRKKWNGRTRACHDDWAVHHRSRVNISAPPVFIWPPDQPTARVRQNYLQQRRADSPSPGAIRLRMICFDPALSIASTCSGRESCFGGFAGSAEISRKIPSPVGVVAHKTNEKDLCAGILKAVPCSCGMQIFPHHFWDNHTPHQFRMTVPLPSSKHK